MKYRMKIVAEESCEMYRLDIQEYVEIAVGRKYKVSPERVSTKKDRANNGRECVVLGFTADFPPFEAVIRYLDTGRRGRVSPGDLLPIELV